MTISPVPAHRAQIRVVLVHHAQVRVVPVHRAEVRVVLVAVPGRPDHPDAPAAAAATPPARGKPLVVVKVLAPIGKNYAKLQGWGVS